MFDLLWPMIVYICFCVVLRYRVAGIGACFCWLVLVSSFSKLTHIWLTHFVAVSCWCECCINYVVRGTEKQTTFGVNYVLYICRLILDESRNSICCFTERDMSVLIFGTKKCDRSVLIFRTKHCCVGDRRIRLGSKTKVDRTYTFNPVTAQALLEII